MFHFNCQYQQASSFPQSNWSCAACDNTALPFSNLNDLDFKDLYTFNSQKEEIMYADYLNKIFGDLQSVDDYDNCDGLDSYMNKLHDTYISTKNAHTLFSQKHSSNTNFSAMSINIRSISNYKNFAKLECLLASLSFSPAVIAVTETWLKPNQNGNFQNLSV